MLERGIDRALDEAGGRPRAAARSYAGDAPSIGLGLRRCPRYTYDDDDEDFFGGPGGYNLIALHARGGLESKVRRITGRDGRADGRRGRRAARRREGAPAWTGAFSQQTTRAGWPTGACCGGL